MATSNAPSLALLFVAPFPKPFSQNKRRAQNNRRCSCLPTIEIPRTPYASPERQTTTAQLVSPRLSTEQPDDFLVVPLQSSDVSNTSEPDIHDESLALLEWPQISEHVLKYASTSLGRVALCSGTSGLFVPSTRRESENLLRETREVYLLEYILCKPLNFSGVHDVAPLVELAGKGKILTGKQLLSIAQTLAAARKMRRHIEASVPSGANENPENLSKLRDMVSSFRTWPDVEREISKRIDDFGNVLDSADPELRGIRNALRDVMQEVRAKLNEIMSRQSDAIQDRVITSRYDRFVIPVKMSRKADFRRGIVHDASASGSTAYIEPASVRPLNDRLRQLTAKEKGRVTAILRQLSGEVVAPISSDVGNLGRVLARLDAATARARWSRSLDAVDVVFDDTKPLKLLGARHPLLSWKAMSEARVGQAHSNEKLESDPSEQKITPDWKSTVIPSSYILDDHTRCVCVTGPNTGGKTLSLKTLGTCVLMAKAGLFVPAKSPSSWLKVARENGLKTLSTDEFEEQETARIPFFDSVLADIGDDQSLVQSLSTFSGHVRRIKRILAASTPKTLILLDEIGSGTDPAEGAALGMAILRYLAIRKRAALTFATTHHGELKTLKYSEEESARYFENASVEFDDVRMAPTYKLIWGIPGRSNALAIAKRLGLSEDVLEEAQYLLAGKAADGSASSNRVDIEKMILSLEREKNTAEAAREQAERSLNEVEQLRSEMNERLERLRKSEQSLRRDQKVAMDLEVMAAKKQIARVIKQMQQGGGSAQAASKASDTLNRLPLPGKQGSASPVSGRPHKLVDVDEIQIGDRVVVPRLSPNEIDVVKVLSRKEVLVAIGGMKAKVKVKEIASVGRRASSMNDEANSRIKETEPSGRRAIVRTAANTVDIRGERVDGAQVSVEKAIDKGLAMGAIWVIHGHGTGRLRSGIREFLNGHPLVEKIEQAEQADGGSGVTIAYLA